MTLRRLGKISCLVLSAQLSTLAVHAATETDCRRMMTSKEEQVLLAKMDELQKNFFAGQLSLAERDAQLDQFVNEARQSGVPLLAGTANILAASLGELHAAELVTMVVIRRLAGQAPTPAELAILEGLQLPPEVSLDQYLDEMGEIFRPHLEILAEAGIRYDAQKAWIFPNRGRDVRALFADPELEPSLSIFFPEAVFEVIRDTKRQEAIIFRGTVFLPASKAYGGRVRALPFAEYEEQVMRYLKIFQMRRGEYLASSKAANSYWNRMKGARAGRNQAKGIKGFFNPDLADSPEEMQANSDYDLMMQAFRTLVSEYGISKTQRKEILELLNQDYEQVDRYIQKSKKQLSAAAIAFPAAFFAVVLLAALPVAAAAGSAHLALAGKTALAAKVMLFSKPAVSLAVFFSGVGGHILYNGVRDTVRAGGHPLCNLAESFYDKAPKSLSMAPLMAFLPSSFSTEGVVGKEIGKEAGKKAIKKVGAQFAMKSGIRVTARIGGVRLATAFVIFRDAAIEKVEGAPECQKVVERALEHIELERPEEIAQNILNERTKACARVLVKALKGKWTAKTSAANI